MSSHSTVTSEMDMDMDITAQGVKKVDEKSDNDDSKIKGASSKGSGMKPKVRARAPELSSEPEYLNFRFFSKLRSGLCFYISHRIK